MIRFVFNLFVCACVLLCTAGLLAWFFPSSTQGMFNLGKHAVTYSIIGAVCVAIATWRSLK